MPESDVWTSIRSRVSDHAKGAATSAPFVVCAWPESRRSTGPSHGEARRGRDAGSACEKKFTKGVDLRGMTLNNSAPRFGGSGNRSTEWQVQCAPVAQLDRVPGYELGGREFESLRARHFVLQGEVLALRLASTERRGLSVPWNGGQGALSDARGLTVGMVARSIPRLR